ncbi:tetratricopeptide repeat protein [Acidihalobacter yilgarnensis]|uniref:tetratricopeptide repeat protein n=1 Tax=Acidihalobacter yilgarnensis TaxID=2819280 RepID=UPI0012E99DA2|nr:hypothetical protein [Acidihalobacter yilgarnensis]
MPVSSAAVVDAGGISLPQVLAYAKAGALELALDSLDTNQPAYSKNPQTWLDWERAKFQLLQKAERWQGVANAAANLPKTLPQTDRTIFETDGAKAWLQLHHGLDARKLLRQLLWSGASTPDEKSVRLWRRLLIEAYLEDNLTDDARLALLQYQADYRIDGRRERDVLARVWLRVGEPRYALDLLKPDAHDTNWLYLLASLRAGARPAATLERDAIHAAQGKHVAPEDAARLWGVAAAAALQRRNWAGAVVALERFLALAPNLPLNPLLPYDGDTLWNTYRHFGEMLGNRDRILLGDDAAWEAAAKRAGKSNHPTQVRAYNALLALTGQTPAGRMTGYRWLLTALLAEPGGTTLVDRLFLSAPKTFAHLSELPVPVRLVLANDAVDRHDLNLAARLMVGVDQAPAGESPYDWTLRVARVLILGGKPKAGVAQLHDLIERSPMLDKAQADRLMQVLFNLQSLKLNQQAIDLFKALLPHLTDIQLRREVLFWEGDSYQAMGHYRESARKYLASALLDQAQAYDQWGQTARYNAAQMLVKAGMKGDARRILSDLLARTKAPARVTFLKQKLAELGPSSIAALGAG